MLQTAAHNATDPVPRPEAVRQAAKPMSSRKGADTNHELQKKNGAIVPEVLLGTDHIEVS